jgi:hypothetical protein
LTVFFIYKADCLRENQIFVILDFLILKVKLGRIKIRLFGRKIDYSRSIYICQKYQSIDWKNLQVIFRSSVKFVFSHIAYHYDSYSGFSYLLNAQFCFDNCFLITYYYILSFSQLHKIPTIERTEYNYCMVYLCCRDTPQQSTSLRHLLRIVADPFV